MGRTPKPLEERRRTGRSPGRDSGGRKLPDPDNVVPLKGVEGHLPDLPVTIQADGAGARRWERIWREARWLAPATDADVVERLCIAEDLVVGMRAALAEQGFDVKGSMGQMRPNPLIAQIRATNAEILKLERECGLTPVSRGVLGVGEVKEAAENPLNEILRQAAGRHGNRRAASGK